MVTSVIDVVMQCLLLHFALWRLLNQKCLNEKSRENENGNVDIDISKID